MAAIFADALVGELIYRLVQLAEDNAPLMIGIKDQIDDLVDDLKAFNALFLRQASRNQKANDNEVVKNVVEMIREVVSDAEDAIGKFCLERKKHKDKGVLRYSEKLAYYTKVNFSAKEIQSIRERIMKIREANREALQALIDDPNRAQPAILQRMVPMVEEDDVVGFDEETKFIKDRLREGLNDLSVISIGGMAGLGKTMLTKMVFKDRDIQYEFFPCLWVYVSRTFNRRQIFLDILYNFTQNTKEFQHMTEESLANKIRKFLEGGKYFIVLDDVWRERDWDCLKIAFPNNMKGSRILVTTRHKDVALHVDTFSNPHTLKFLENKESWELLQKKVFRKEKCPESLEAIGKRIAIKCNGLPLAVVVLAGVLDKDTPLTEWKRVADDPLLILNRKNQNYNELVKVSYDHLPYHMKHCFLYLAAFPIGYEIPVWKLIRLWVAEGFIPQMEGRHNSELEHTAEKYIKDLVDKNLLMVLKRKADGQVKTCRLHDTLHEFCKIQADNENLFHEMEGDRLEENKIPRRLCVHSTILDFLKSENKPSSEHVRSFLSFCSKEIEVPNEHIAVIPKSFPLLRVMDVESLKFKLLPKDYYLLYHLRYLAISTELKILPKFFNNLWNMQTLVFNTSQDSLEVKADIWSIPKLRHVHSNTSMQLPPPSKNSKSSPESTDILTLSTISPSSCMREIFDKTPNLQKLGIRGNLIELMENKGGVCLFDNLQVLDRLENLKLINDEIHGSRLRNRPRAEIFPRRLRKMTLSNTAFEWNYFGILGSLEELEVLKLKDNAFKGEFCDVSNVVFKQLQYLSIGMTDLVSWIISKDSFKELKYLILRNCSDLDAVPFAFSEVESLKVIELFCTNKRAASSAREIRKMKLVNEGSEDRFQLSIFPPDH